MKRSLERSIQRKDAAEREAQRLRDEQRLSVEPPRYGEWLDFFFGRFERDCDDPWQMYWRFAASAEETADLFIYTFSNCGRDLAKYTDSQVSTGLQALLFTNYGDAPHVLINAGLSEDRSAMVLRSFGPLYRELLAKRSPPVLGHLSESQGNPLEFVTYMLWDVSPFDVMAAKSDEGIGALLEVFHDALHLPNEACIESALHGLGHSGGKMREGARGLVDAWLDERPKVRPELIAYAQAARTGCIL